MTTIAMPEPDYGILRRRREILAELENAVPGILISDPAETLAYECDALTAYHRHTESIRLLRKTHQQ